MMAQIPNILTICRIVLILPFALLILAGFEEARWAALVLFIIAALTDWLDGYLARRLDAFSPWGRMLDPIADKLLVAAALVLLVATGAIGGWGILPVLAILLREIAVSGLREHLGSMGVVVPVSKLAKWKTATQLVSIALLIAPLGGVTRFLGLVLLWVAAALTLATGWDYLKTARASPLGPNGH